MVKKMLTIITALTGVMLITAAQACTGIQLKTKDGVPINGRTVEFGEKIDMNVLVIPRNHTFVGILPDGGGGLAYRSKYAAVGIGPVDEDIIADGINEVGLSAGAFYLPNYAGYANIDNQNKNHAVSPFEFVNWLLTQFATVKEIRQGLDQVVIAPTVFKAWGFAPPLHYVVYDKTGNSLVIEPIQGHLVVYDNPLGVITNSPTFDWHMTNLQNFINLSVVNVPAVTMSGVTLRQLGTGNGLHGLPGDFTSPSRFVRAAIFSSAAPPAENAEAAVFQTFHLLNQFDIPAGSVRAVDKKNGKIYLDYTMLTSVKDPKNLRYYFKTYDDQNVRMIDLKDFDVTTTAIKKASTARKPPPSENMVKQLS